MNSLITEQGNAEIIRRLESLVPERAPAWGKMSAPRMLAHCQRPLQVAAGRL